MGWMIDNSDWIFSGIGVLVLTVFGGVFFKKNVENRNMQSIKSGNNSTNIIGSKNVRVNNGRNSNE